MIQTLLSPIKYTFDYFISILTKFTGWDMGYNRIKDPLFKEHQEMPPNEWLVDAINNTTKHNIKLSDKITNIFTSTKVNVIEIYSNEIKAWTIPGSAEMTKVWKYENIMSIPFYGPTWSVLMTTIERFKNGFNFEQYNNKELYFNPTTKKLTSSVPEATVFVTSRMVEMMSEDEITAILIHEVGKNTSCAIDAFVAAIKWALNILALVYLYPGFISKIGGTVTKILPPPNTDNKLLNYGYGATLTAIVGFAAIFFFALLAFCIRYIPAYLVRRVEIDADEFVVKCGYGEASLSALKKIQQFKRMTNDYNLREPAYNAIEKIVFKFQIWYWKLGEFLASYNLGDRLSLNNKYAELEAKQKAFDPKSTDRSNPLEYIEPEYKTEEFPTDITPPKY